MTGRGNPTPNRPAKPLSAADLLSNPTLLSAYIAAYSSLSNARPPRPPQMSQATYDQILAKTMATYNTKPRPVNTAPVNRPVAKENRTVEEQDHSRIVRQRIDDALKQDQEKILNPSTELFVNKEDMVSRLVAFHLVQIPDLEVKPVEFACRELVEGATSRIKKIEALEQDESNAQKEMMSKFAEFLTTLNK
ncbi:hypothetical protein HDV01_002625 [Terramyces sp. JEL0728]|nr:hypothetical protein HDV01_002625 [Terramyces sp. JEL0728]